MARSKTVVITGEINGISRALAAGFLADGDRVIGLGRSEWAVDESLANPRCGGFTFRTVDVSDPGATEAAFDQIAIEAGPIDVLITNAAVYPREFFVDQSPEDWNRTILINLCGVANCCRAVLPAMLARNHGRIVVIGSLADNHPIPASSAYSVSRAALHCLVRAIASEIDATTYPDVLINEHNPHVTRLEPGGGADETIGLYPRVRRLVDLPPGGASGRVFYRDKELRPKEGLKTQLRHALSPLLGGR